MVSISTTPPVGSGFAKKVFHAPGQAALKKDGSYVLINKKSVEIRFNFQGMTQQAVESQNALFHFNRLNSEDKSSLVYNGRPISELSAEEASDLISDTGYFGVEKTSQRIIDFVIQGAGDDSEKLRAGREGILKGIQEAEKAWGGKLPDISYQTLEKSLEAIDEKLQAQNSASIVDLSV